MSPDPRPEIEDEPPIAPTLDEQDWNEAVIGDIAPESIPENGDFRYDEPDREVAEVEDDNPYQEALPDDPTRQA